MKLVINDEKKNVVELIFRVYLRTFNLSRVMENLREIGIEMPNKSLQYIIHNPIYKGVFRGIESFCEPIISAEDWDKAQRVKKPYTANKHKGEYIFSGIVKCAYCGKTMRGLCANDKYHMYQCRSGCRNSITQRELEKRVIDQLQPALDKYRLIVKKRKFDKKKNDEDRKKLKEKLKRLTDLYVDGIIDRSSFDNRKKEIDSQLDELTPQPDIPELATNWKTIYDNLNTDQKSALWRAFCDHITVDRDKNVDIAFEQAKVLVKQMAMLGE
jgi:site-specific DNA recombinase